LIDISSSRYFLAHKFGEIGPRLGGIGPENFHGPGHELAHQVLAGHTHGLQVFQGLGQVGFQLPVKVLIDLFPILDDAHGQPAEPRKHIGRGFETVSEPLGVVGHLGLGVFEGLTRLAVRAGRSPGLLFR